MREGVCRARKGLHRICKTQTMLRKQRCSCEVLGLFLTGIGDGKNRSCENRGTVARTGNTAKRGLRRLVAEP